MKNALAATRATLTWLVVTASMLTAGLVVAVPAGAATKTYTASAATQVHASPATTAAVLGTLAKGDKVAAAGAAASGWLPITYAAKTGYVPTSTVTLDKSPAAAFVAGPAGKRLAALTVNLRASASLDADIVAVVKKSAVLKVTGVVSGNFAQVDVRRQDPLGLLGVPLRHHRHHPGRRRHLQDHRQAGAARDRGRDRQEPDHRQEERQGRRHRHPLGQLQPGHLQGQARLGDHRLPQGRLRHRGRVRAADPQVDPVRHGSTAS